ncbi:hypothetical protein TruAng_010061 [Truncatella angustata]|nr:hypothetical protein TruAng_010061 [Truncatella angustata]
MTGSFGIFTAKRAQIHSTISQDFSGGRSSRESTALAKLGSMAECVSTSGESKLSQNAPLPVGRDFQAQAESPSDLRRAELQNQAAAIWQTEVANGTSNEAAKIWTSPWSMYLFTSSAASTTTGPVKCASAANFIAAEMSLEATLTSEPSGSVGSDSTSFIVFRYYRCSDAGSWDHSPGKAVSDTGIRYDESCTSDSAAYYPRNSSSYNHSSHSNGEREDDLNEYTPVFFYHHRRKLANMLNLLEGQAKIQVLALVNYIETTQGDRFRELDSSIAQGIVHSHNIMMLFCPNDVVVSKPGGIWKAHVLRAWPRIGGTGFMLECWHWAFNGGALSRNHTTLDITKPVQGIVQIRDLEVFPAKFAIAEELRHLESRGAKFWSLRYQSYVAYAGWDSKGDQFYTNESRWMVDYRTYRQMHPTPENFVFRDVAKVAFDRWPETIPCTLETLESNCSVLLPPEIHAFSFKKKKWSSLLVDHIRPVKWNTDAFERLVLPAKTKDLVKSLVMVRASPRESKKRKLLDMMRDDIIAGKGNGLIILLHGPPGTGKTLTAGLTEIVLLLDEADVFLEERSLADLERNSLVSVFLRMLEYYNGILIITSNRVGTIDAAFTSRIQVALHYAPLTSASRRKIWQNFFDMLRIDEEDVDLDDLLGHFDELVRDYDMNGRQIRNAFTTARQLAIFKGETLTWGHLEQALQSVRKFNTYLQTLHGPTDDQ